MGRKGMEQALYQPIRGLLSKPGTDVREQFDAYNSDAVAQRKVDLIRFAWREDGSLDVWAIEAKEGNGPEDVLAAVPQACAYQTCAPRVSIACSAHGRALGYAEKVLRQLGLGFISTTNRRAIEEWEPADSLLLQPDDARILGHAGAAILLTKGLYPDVDLWPHSSVLDRGRSGKHNTVARPGWSFCVHPRGDVQVMLRVRNDSANVSATVWVQKKPALRRILKSMTPEAFQNTLSRRDLVAVFSHRRVDELGRLEPEERRVTAGESLDATAEAIAQARRWLNKSDRRVPVIDIPIPLWPQAVPVERHRLEPAFQSAMERLLPVRDYLAGFLIRA